MLNAGPIADKHGATAFARAAQLDHVDVMKRLLAAGAAVNAALRSGDSPLHLACEEDRGSAARFLVVRLERSNTRPRTTVAPTSRLTPDTRHLTAATEH